MLNRIHCFAIIVLLMSSLAGCYSQHPQPRHHATPEIIFPTQPLPDRSYHCISFHNEMYCGYNCRVTGRMAKCSPEPDKICITNAVGEIACGYACIRDGLNMRCTQRRTDNCAKDAYGHIMCGEGCGCTAGRLHCHIEH